jgi:SPP1 family predicted phage head-tail adaptor
VLSKSINQKATRIQLQNPGPAVPDGDGGWTEAWNDLDPAIVQAAVGPAGQSRLEHLVAGTVLSQATHLVTIWYHPGVTTKTRINIVGTPRTMNVLALADPDERHVELELVCAEVVA